VGTKRRKIPNAVSFFYSGIPKKTKKKTSGRMERELYRMVVGGYEEGVRDVLRNNPEVDVNWTDDHRRTVLHWACINGKAPVVTLLLAHPAIEVNPKDFEGFTPFKKACYHGRSACVRVLLKDSRVELGAVSTSTYTPICWAACRGFDDVIKWWVASGRQVDLGEPGNPLTDPVAAVKRTEPGLNARSRARAKALLEMLGRFKEDPEETRAAVRTEIGWYEELAAEVFALVVFVSDGILRLKEGGNQPAITPPATRFFTMTSMLPLELQMVLCYRLVGSVKEIIPRLIMEEAFKDQVRSLGAKRN